MSAKLALLLSLPLVLAGAAPSSSSPRFQVVAMAEAGGLHEPFVKAAKVWLDKLAAENNFKVDYIETTDPINDAFLSKYKLFIQLNYAPYAWKPAAVAAFEKYINEGRGGWIGFHHATLLGEFDGYKIWPWFRDFMGGIRFAKYIPDFADGTVKVERAVHPVMKGVPATFPVGKEEWYTYDKSPRPNVQVLASVDENTYVPSDVPKMGDHPVVWTNPHYKARNVYMFMGHRPDLFENQAFVKMFRNSVFWAAGL